MCMRLLRKDQSVMHVTPKHLVSSYNSCHPALPGFKSSTTCVLSSFGHVVQVWHGHARSCQHSLPSLGCSRMHLVIFGVCLVSGTIVWCLSVYLAEEQRKHQGRHMEHAPPRCAHTSSAVLCCVHQSAARPGRHKRLLMHTGIRSSCYTPATGKGHSQRCAKQYAYEIEGVNH